MRALLEFLRFIGPDRARREPVALPAWIRWALPVAVVTLALASTLVLVLLHASS